MAKNDKILLDAIIDDRVELQVPSDKRDEAFEYLAFQQILKDYDLSQDETESGWIDGHKDGGIDGFFIFVNGHLLQYPESFMWPRTGSELHVSIITCKHHDTFKQSTLDKLVASLTELLDFEVDNNELKGGYSESVIKLRNNLRLAYRKLSPRMSKFTADFCYASRGNTSEIGDEVRSRAEQIKSIASDCFSTCVPQFTFLGSKELVELHRRMRNYSLELPFIEVLSRGERYVLLARLADYYLFTSEEGRLRRYLFESNVRDFMGLNRVNEDIKATLHDINSPDFWWLNNGITILATSASVVGKSIQIEDIQIVNGLQTTESIFRHFTQGGSDPEDRSVLVKIIVSREETVRDAIIRATNNQTDVELASLHATDKIQRDIEDILLRKGLFYERRKNHYTNLGHTSREVITPLYLASGYVSLLLKQPHKAAVLKSKFMRSQEAYKLVFSDTAPIDVWPKIATVLKKTDELLEKLRPTKKITEGFLKGWRHIICFFTISRLLGRFDFLHEHLIALDTESAFEKELLESWKYIHNFGEKNIGRNIWSKKGNIVALCVAGGSHFGINGIERVQASQDFGYGATEADKFKKSIRTIKARVDMDFALKVKDLLPPQPWKPGLHKLISTSLCCSNSEYFSAVELLIHEGLVNRQVDGVVYDPSGDVLCFDPERVEPKTMKLLENKR
ncbi:AIPR family protein [Nitrosospira sp. NpAV]|uniref:AIPR family protein n=1 Tax=Nitrosospira sp. NpAV TaxID=58133 RepID=UPI0005A2AFA2|nr:AIPR family protein [Nitrosospira sp. NpAV]KIO49319.1 abortive phage resistance protein [Nitrosospira sp. NpAV]